MREVTLRSATGDLNYFPHTRFPNGQLAIIKDATASSISDESPPLSAHWKYAGQPFKL